MKSYFAYIRVSTVKQGERGSSLQEQRSAIEAYAARNGLHISQWFEEVQTAAKQGRRAFGRMITEVRKGRSAGVIIHKIDRSARNLKDWAQIGDIMDSGAEVHCAHDSLDLSTRGGRLSADIQAVIAADYIRNLREEVRKGVYGRLNQGLYPFAAPIGYRNCGSGKAKEIDPVAGPLVGQMFDLYGTGRFSLDTLRKEMAGRGLLVSGRPFSINVTAHILHQTFYMGIITLPRTGETFAGIHPPLISKKLFDRVQAVMAGRLSPRPAKHRFLFSRRIRCSACGRSLIGERQKGHTYYRCHTRSCAGTSLNEVSLTAAMNDVFALLKLSDEEVRDVRDVKEAAIADHDRDRQKWLSAKRLQLARCDERRRRLTDALLDGTIDKEIYEIKNAELINERRGLLDDIEGPPGGADVITLLEKLERANMAYSLYELADDEQKATTLDFVLSNLSVVQKNPVISLYYPFSEVAKWCLCNEGEPARVDVRTFAPTSGIDTQFSFVWDDNQLKIVHETVRLFPSNEPYIQSLQADPLSPE